MNRALPVKDALSAGGVIWRRDLAGMVEVALCGQTTRRTWALPKGAPNPGESLEQTAIREAQEETGLAVALGARLHTIDYWFTIEGARYHKFVHYWLMRAVGGDVSGHDKEFDEVAWFPSGEALGLVSYASERAVLKLALAAIESAGDG